MNMHGVLNVSLLLICSSYVQAYGIGRCYRKTRRAARCGMTSGLFQVDYPYMADQAPFCSQVALQE